MKANGDKAAYSFLMFFKLEFIEVRDYQKSPLME
jgi:hypothetical protein